MELIGWTLIEWGTFIVTIVIGIISAKVIFGTMNKLKFENIAAKYWFIFKIIMITAIYFIVIFSIMVVITRFLL